VHVDLSCAAVAVQRMYTMWPARHAQLWLLSVGWGGLLLDASALSVSYGWQEILLCRRGNYGCKCIEQCCLHKGRWVWQFSCGDRIKSYRSLEEIVRCSISRLMGHPEVIHPTSEAAYVGECPQQCALQPVPAVLRSKLARWADPVQVLQPQVACLSDEAHKRPTSA
jgi:hypothetical protein